MQLDPFAYQEQEPNPLGRTEHFLSHIMRRTWESVGLDQGFEQSVDSLLHQQLCLLSVGSLGSKLSSPGGQGKSMSLSIPKSLPPNQNPTSPALMKGRKVEGEDRLVSPTSSSGENWSPAEGGTKMDRESRTQMAPESMSSFF